MNHSASVSLFESFANLDSVFQNLFGGQWTFKQTIGQRLAFQIFHDEKTDPVLLADIIEKADVGMTQRRDSTGFPIEALLGLGFFRQMFG